MLKRYLILLLIGLVSSVVTLGAQENAPMVIPNSKKEVQGDSLAKVIVKGDTVSVILPGKNYSRFDRGLYNHLFVPKGQWMFGATASYSEFNTDDVQLLSFLKDFNFKGKSVSVNPYGAYFFRSNQSAGVKLGYSKDILDLGSLSIDIDEDMSLKHFDTDFSNYRSQNSAEYSPNGALYIAKPKEYLKRKHFFGDKSLAYIMNEFESIDVDTEIDYDYACLIMEKYFNKEAK